MSCTNTRILLLVEEGVMEAVIPVDTQLVDVVLTFCTKVWSTTCNTAPVAALMLSMPVAPVIVVVITYPFGLADFTAARRACKSVKVSPPSNKA